MTKQRNAHEFVLQKSDMERTIGPSLTVPDMAMSIKEILEKHVHGIPLPIVADVYYDDVDDPEYQDVTRQPDVDLTDVYDQLDEIKQRLAAASVPKADPVESQPGAEVKE